MSLLKHSLIVALALALSGAGNLLSAQVGARGGLGMYGFGPRLGENIQLALLHQDELGLTEEQVSSLTELQAGIAEEVAPLEDEMNALRDRILAGEVGWSTGVLRLQELRAQYETAAAPYRTRVADVLSVDQHRALQTIMLDTRPLAAPGMPGAAGVLPGRGLGTRLAPGLGAGRAYYGAGLGRGPGYGRGMGPGLGRGRAGFYGRRGPGRAGGFYRWR